jgi:hypothetical protein
VKDVSFREVSRVERKRRDEFHMQISSEEQSTSFPTNTHSAKDTEDDEEREITFPFSICEVELRKEQD